MELTKGQKVYISSSDSRLKGFEATITSMGSKYVTVTDNYGRKYRFDAKDLYCIDWGIYRLEESEQSCNERKLREEKLCVIRLNINSLGNILSDSEIDDIYNRIIKKH